MHLMLRQLLQELMMMMMTLMITLMMTLRTYSRVQKEQIVDGADFVSFSAASSR